MKNKDKVRALRADTHLEASLRDCAAALDEAEGDLERAKGLLREWGRARVDRALPGGGVPDDAPPGWAYLIAKVDLYLRLGPERYRRLDHFGLPSADWDEETLALIASCFLQFAEGKGYTAQNPVTGVGIEAFYSATQTLHFELVEQSASLSPDSRTFVDAMLMQHLVDKRRITFFNAVSSHTGQ